jgi:tRNA threonylcarbamoyladenosine biosynthesis protein TsaE
MTGVFLTESEIQTEGVARRLAASLPPGAVVLLTGDLGAGKTAFVRGMASGLGIDPEEVSSPTFALIHEYRSSTGPSGPGFVQGRSAPVLAHVDLYRLERAEIEDLGLDELGESGAVVAIEWAEKLGASPAGAHHVTITDLGGDAREIRIEEQ